MSGSISTSTVHNAVTAVAIGNFDGMHIGHRALFERLGERGGIVVIEHYRATLTPGVWRAEYSDHPLFFYDFDRIRNLSPREFVERLKRDFPRLERIVVGEDFRFGAKRSADVRTLKTLFEGETLSVAEVKVEGEGVHTRHIRRLIEEGDLKRAETLLGRPYALWGETLKGQGIGSRSLVPTINVDAGRFLLPKPGVYRTQTRVGEEFFPSVTFLGHRYTTDGQFALETHLLDWTPPRLPPWRVQIVWERFLRENRKFESLGALKAQILEDIEKIKTESRDPRNYEKRQTF